MAGLYLCIRIVIEHSRKGKQGGNPNYKNIPQPGLHEKRAAL